MKKLFCIVLAATFVLSSTSLYAQDKAADKDKAGEVDKDKAAPADKDKAAPADKDKAPEKDKAAPADKDKAPEKDKAAGNAPPDDRIMFMGYLVDPKYLFFFAVLIVAIGVIYLFFVRKKPESAEGAPPM